MSRYETGQIRPTSELGFYAGFGGNSYRESSRTPDIKRDLKYKPNTPLQNVSIFKSNQDSRIEKSSIQNRSDNYLATPLSKALKESNLISKIAQQDKSPPKIKKSYNLNSDRTDRAEKNLLDKPKIEPYFNSSTFHRPNSAFDSKIFKSVDTSTQLSKVMHKTPSVGMTYDKPISQKHQALNYSLEAKNGFSDILYKSPSKENNRISKKQPILTSVPGLPTYESTKFSQKKFGVVKAYAVNSNQGLVRNYNEDRVSIILNITKPNNHGSKYDWPLCSFFGVYDGHGGTGCADFLRDTLHQYVIQDSNFPHNPVQAIRNGFAEAEKKFISTAQKPNGDIEHSGSCAIVVVVVANVGDSRAIMSTDRGKRSIPLSRDHKPNDEEEKSRILKNGGKVYQSQTPQLFGMDDSVSKVITGPFRVHPGRLSVLLVARTFGDIEAKLIKYGGNPNVVIAEPEIKSFRIDDNCDFIVLASDGIFDKLDTGDAVKSIWEGTSIKAGNVHEQTSYCVEYLMKEALLKKTLDNITVVMISLKNFKRAVFPKKAKEIQKYQKHNNYQLFPNTSTIGKYATLDERDKKKNKEDSNLVKPNKLEKQWQPGYQSYDLLSVNQVKNFSNNYRDHPNQYNFYK